MAFNQVVDYEVFNSLKVAFVFNCIVFKKKIHIICSVLYSHCLYVCFVHVIIKHTYFNNLICEVTLTLYLSFSPSLSHYLSLALFFPHSSDAAGYREAVNFQKDE